MFNIGAIYKRSHIHDMYGGNRQNGISVSAKTSNIFIFTGSGGKLYGYKDQWENSSVFSYTGEGQIGDMQFTRGNLALKDHLKSGKKVFLFKYIKQAYVEFVSEVDFIDYDYFETFDRNSDLRIGIKFFFKRTEARLYDIPSELLRINEPIEVYKTLKPNITERGGLVMSRVGQGAYRKSIYIDGNINVQLQTTAIRKF